MADGPPRPSAGTPALAATALVLNAFVWGTSWWPLRRLHAEGLHPLWATAIVFSLATLVVVALRPRAVAQLLRTPALWLLLAAAGTTNAAFNWAVVMGDVVRVVLLFYLMPLWAVLLARIVLGERFTAAAAWRMALALLGAAIVLWPAGAEGIAGAAASSSFGDAAAQPGLAGDGGRAGGALPGVSGASDLAVVALRAARGNAAASPFALADWLAIAGGFAFACNNVLLRREAGRPEAGPALAMFTGAALVATVLATALSWHGQVSWPAGLSTASLAGIGVLTAAFLGGNFALQYGAALLPANRTAVIMLTEVVFASASAVALGAGHMTPRLALGGGLIVASALLAARGRH